MIVIKQIEITCDNCKEVSNMRLDWSNFRLPEGWMYRTRSFEEDDKPSDINIICKKCYEKI